MWAAPPAAGQSPLLLLVLVVGCVDTSPRIDFDAADLRCNGLTPLCDRRVDQVVFLRAHNAHSSQERGFLPGAMNHYFAVPRQLADGVRSLNFDVYTQSGETLLCHGICSLGSQPAAEALREIADFLGAERFEVVLLDLQNETTLADTARAFEASGVLRFAHTQTAGEPWPTLREMIRADRRLVILGNRRAGAPPWYHAKEDFLFGTKTHYETAAELDCALASGPIPHGLLDITHILTNPLPDPANAEAINHDPLLSDRVRGCIAALGRLPTTISLDFYSVGDGLALVRALNEGR